MQHEWIEKCRRLDFDRLNALVSERINALRLYVENIDKAEDDSALHDAVCRDLIFPTVAGLAQFIDSVKLTEQSE